jgi:nitrate reductase NapE component
MDERFQIAGKGKQQRQASSTGLRQRIRQIPWMLLAVISLVILAVLAIGGYFLNWTWTGFSGNTLWDWLKLLITPVVLTGATIWFTIRQKHMDKQNSPLQASQQQRQKWNISGSVLISVVLIVFVVLIIGGYFLNWTWTGFSGNTLWDWLSLLLLPLALTAATIWFTIMEEEVVDEVEASEEGMVANPDRTRIDPERTIIDRSNRQ